ncbi:Copia protein [Symbiodinium microadriaticum]|uniref:Copia protein n=1 Tax=Symbiodinium microadriaticum TaxID=2951 RepID=A0A1Q9CDN8_SYMMI|nr:Copia protein [Symbiodinium microadriaticum]
MAKPSAAGKSKTTKKAADPLDNERTEGPDLRDPRTKGGPCFGNHKVAKAYKGSVSGSTQYGSWTGCEVCKIRLSYTPRMGCHGIHRKSAPLAKDVTSVLEDLPPETEAYPSNKEISLTAAENSALARQEHLRRLRKDSHSKNTGTHSTLVEPADSEDPVKTKDQSSKNTGDPVKTRDQSSKNTGDFTNVSTGQQSTGSSPISPGTIVVDPEELPRHPGRKAARPSTQIAEELDQVEGFADYLTSQKAFDYQSMEELLGMMKPRTFIPGRASSVPERKAGFSMVFGLYAHGSYFGCTRASRMYPSVCRYLNLCVRNFGSETVSHWTSVSVLVNMKGSMHLDAHNDSSSYNLAVGLGPYEGGELWVELRDGDPSTPNLPLSWREIPGGKRAPGQVHSTRWCPTVFSPKRYHKTLPWTGTRYSVIAYTARSWPEARDDPELLHQLRRLQFPLSNSSLPPASGEMLAAVEEDLHDGEEPDVTYDEEQLTLEDRSEILATYQDFEGALREIFLEYPNEKMTKVVNVCTPWLDPLAMEQVLQEQEWNYQGLSHLEGCDLSTHVGFQTAQEQIGLLGPEWLWCHVPRGPTQLFAGEHGWDDPRRASKAKRYLKVLRHLLLLSRDHVIKGGKLMWLIPPDSVASSVREVQRFWNVHGRGTTLHVSSAAQVLSNVLDVADLKPSTPSSKFWTSVTTTSRAATAWMLEAEGDTVFPVDTSCLNTLTTSELERLMQHVRQLHRRFGHPSNRLLVKNLLHRNADEKVVAAASQLECDECLESQIKMPSPAVNLDKCEKLWSCLQVDGFHLRCGATVYHFLLMVDEASGFAVVREMFSHPEEDHQNMSGPEVVQVLQEAWFQYFGYPDTIKLDLEGALRSRALHEACTDKGIDLLPAPAEYHEMIADVEREIGYVRQHLERFLRGGAFEKPGQAALAAVTAHNSLARVHGFSPLQWALGRDMSLGQRASDAPADQISATRNTTFNNQGNLRLEAEQAFLKYRADQLASRAKNAKVRVQVRYFPGDMVFYRRHKTPADLPANSWVDRPRLRGARWYGPARVLACETKTEEGYRKPSQYVWAICSGRLKKFHATQLRHASPSERLTHEALRDITMPWTMTSLTRLLDKGSYDDETRTRASRNVMLGRKKRGLRRRPGEASPPLPRPAVLPPRLPDAPLEPPISDEEMIPDAEMRKAPRLHEPVAGASSPTPELDVDRLLNDPQYMPSSRATGFQEQRRLHEQEDRPWHVQHGQLMYSEEEVGSGIYAVTLDMPANDKEWRKVLKDPRKFMAKSVQKGVEVSWNRLDDVQRAAMSEAKKAEVDSWIANRVVKAALPHITKEQSLRMRWIYTFKAAEPGKVKAKARMVILGYSDPSLLEQETSSPAMSRQSKMLFFNYATARRWRILAGDVKTAFLQAKAPNRQHPLHAQPLPELAKAMNLTEDQMVELLGSAYGLTSAPREWYQDLTSTLRRLKAQACLSDPCIWRLFDESGEKVIGLIGLYVDDILFCGDEGSELYCQFLHDLHQAYSWSPWESDNFSHCGVRVQQFADASILLDHSEFCSELVQMPSRSKDDDSELTAQEISQARAILGSIQWRASQTAPQHSAKVSYLLSMLATKKGEVVDMVNKLVREVHLARHVAVKIQQLECDPAHMILVGWSDAAVANRPDLKSTGGHLFGLMNPQEVQQGYGKVNAITWKSSRLNRVARSSLSAETQALADLDGEMMYARLTWAEMNGHRGDLKLKDEWIRAIPAIMVIDARALFDALERGDLTISSMKDKFSALETLALAQSMSTLGTQLQWTDSDHQLADGLTKIQKQDQLKRFLASGCWRLRHPGALMSAKKRRALEALGSLSMCADTSLPSALFVSMGAYPDPAGEVAPLPALQRRLRKLEEADQTLARSPKTSGEVAPLPALQRRLRKLEEADQTLARHKIETLASTVALLRQTVDDLQPEQEGGLAQEGRDNTAK